MQSQSVRNLALDERVTQLHRHILDTTPENQFTSKEENRSCNTRVQHKEVVGYMVQ